MITYRYKKPDLLFVGINPHPGSFERGVPFSNNKMFWYLLSDAGLIPEQRAELKNDRTLAKLYKEKFNAVYKLGFVNIIDRPTPNISKLIKNEELSGRKRITRIIKTETPQVVCFVGKITYAKFIARKEVAFGWQADIGNTKVYVMHAPLRGEASVRVKELQAIKRVVAMPIL